MSITVPQFEVVIDGVSYQAETAKVERFSIGWEDHGLFTVFLDFAGPGWGQGIGCCSLDSYDEALKTRIGTSFGCDYIMGVAKLLGSPEVAKGKSVLVLRKTEDGYHGMIDGFALLHEDGTTSEPFLVSALRRRHYPDV